MSGVTSGITDSNGHIWQGRFKAFPVQEDDHLRVVLRYIERNAAFVRLLSSEPRIGHGPVFTVRRPALRP